MVGDGVDFIDTRDPERATVHFTHAEFAAFAEGVKAGEFDLGDPPDEDEGSEA